MRAVGLLALASLAACSSPNAREIIRTERAPAPIGPYSQAVRVGDRLFVAGQIGVDPASGALASGGAAAETRRALQNLQAVVEAAGFTLADVVETEIFLADLERFAEVNAVYAEFFPSDPPARATVQVARLPKNAAVEIRLSAVRTPR